MDENKTKITPCYTMLWVPRLEMNPHLARQRFGFQYLRLRGKIDSLWSKVTTEAKKAFFYLQTNITPCQTIFWVTRHELKRKINFPKLKVTKLKLYRYLSLVLGRNKT